VRNGTGRQLTDLSDAPQRALSCKAVTVLGLSGALCQGKPKRREKNIGCKGSHRLKEAELCRLASFISSPDDCNNNKAIENTRFTEHCLL